MTMAQPMKPNPPTLFDLLHKVPLRITGGDKYHWECYGPNARYLDFADGLDCIFDEENAMLYEVNLQVLGTRPHIWRSMKYEGKFISECMEKRMGADVENETANILTIDEMYKLIKENPDQ